MQGPDVSRVRKGGKFTQLFCRLAFRWGSFLWAVGHINRPWACGRAALRREPASPLRCLPFPVQLVFAGGHDLRVDLFTLPFFFFFL